MLTLTMLLTTSALNIQKKKKDPVAYAAVPSGSAVSFGKTDKTVWTGQTGMVSFGKTDKTIISAPIYDVSDEPFQNINLAKRFGTDADHDFDANAKAIENFDGEQDKDGSPTNLGAKEKAKIVAEKMKECTPEASLKLTKKYPVEKIPAGFPQKSGLPAGSFYAQQAAEHSQATYGCSEKSCQLPTYLAPREEAKNLQVIPRIIWMTTSDQMLAGKAGPFQYNMMAEHWTKNPEYEFVCSGDAMSAAFMETDEVKPEWREAYKKARNGAEKADIWRYAVMYKYGGVYMDTDMSAFAAYNTFVDAKADVVQQATNKGKGAYEMSQFALLFAPKHPLMLDVLTGIAAKFSAPALGSVMTIALTGPGALAASFAKHTVCGMTPEKGSTKVSGKNMKSACESKELGKVVLLMAERDFNTGHRWHKDDVCALAESRTLFSHWAQAGKAAGGKGKKFAAEAR